MSKFAFGKIYIIIEDSNITIEMLNYSTSMSKSTMPSKEVNGVLYRIIEVHEPVPIILSGLTWYDINTISAAWEALA